MNTQKIGELIGSLRKERGLTQKELADVLNISDRTVSKWERGFGCPDVSCLNELSTFLNINIEKLLEGELAINQSDHGNLKKIQFTVCPVCKNMTSSTGNAEISCCGRKLAPLIPKSCDAEHQMSIQFIDGEYFVSSKHAMTKQHSLSFAAYVTSEKVVFTRLYPEQNAEFRIPKMGGDLYLYCNKHGLMKLTSGDIKKISSQ